MAYGNARLTPAGRRLLCQRTDGGSPIAHVPAAMGVSRQCASKWWHRWREFGDAGLEDRPCAPMRRTRVSARVEDRIVYLRRTRTWGPDRIAGYIGQARSTVHRTLLRRGMSRLEHLDRQSGREIRRYEHPHPGSLVHVDVKKLGRIPKGVAGGRTAARRPSAAAASATPTSTPPSTTTAAWPTSRSSPTSGGPPRPGSGDGPPPSTAPTASWWSGS